MQPGCLAGAGGRGGGWSGGYDGGRREPAALSARTLVVTTAGRSGVADPALWAALSARGLDAVAAYFRDQRGLAPQLAGVRFSSSHSAVKHDFGEVPAYPAAPPLAGCLGVENFSRAGGLRISDVVLRPTDAPFRIAASPKGTMLAVGADAVPISVEFDLAAAARLRRDMPLPKLVCAWCLVELEMATCPEDWPTQWTVTRSCIGAEVRAMLVAPTVPRRRFPLAAGARQFFPSGFRRCFDDPASAVRLPPLADEDAADALIPAGLRRVVPTIGRAVLKCPPREVRLRGGEQLLSSDSDGRRSGQKEEDDKTASLRAYRQRLSLALCLEAEQMFRDIKMYDICAARLVPVPEAGELYVRLRVEGISESRPALVLFDPVRLRPTHVWLYSDVEIVARVAAVDSVQSTVTLKVPEVCSHNPMLRSLLSLASDDTKPFRAHVRFCVGSHFKANTLLLDAVKRLDFDLHSRLKQPPPMCTGRELAARAQTARSALSQVDGAAAVLSDLNSRQWEAVYASATTRLGTNGKDFTETRRNPWPVLVFGPPGTGKTRTLCAAMAVALLKHGESARILATAPSHQAADVLCERLSEVLRKVGNEGMKMPSMFRLNPFERPASYARTATLPYCYQSGTEGYFDLPPLEQLASYNVIVCTFSSSSLLSELPSDHFWTGVFCDECAQSLEPEALVPLTMFGCQSRIVLSGDPQQLNAEVRSQEAAKLGLHMSLMEGMMRVRAGIAGGYCPFNVQLRVNYRVRHRALIEFSSAFFYNNSLITRPDLPERTVVDRMRNLFPSGIPLKFIGVDSPEEKVSERSPGLTNHGEAMCIADLCYRMTGMDGTCEASCASADLAVIAPYRCQVQLIRKLLREMNLGEVNVGTVHDQQGMERQVVLVSLTLSSGESLRAEEASHQGFAGSPKKFNVAITRACELLVVVGNPSVLLQEACWGAFIRQMVRTGCYSGVEFPGMAEVSSTVRSLEDDLRDLAGITAVGSQAMTDYTALVSELEGEGEGEGDREEGSGVYEEREYAFLDGEDVAWRVLL
jgi:hypothetical protein